MTYHVDRTAQLETAVARNRFGSVASLRASGTPTKQHNVEAPKPKKTAAKKTAAKKTTAQKTAVTKAPSKKAAKK